MPKSKREKKSALTQVQKKTRAVKDALVSKIRASIEQYPRVYVFEVAHMKNTLMKRLREEWNDSKFYLGKNKVMQLALGRTAEEEQKQGLAALARQVTGSRGLLFTEKTESEVRDFFSNYSEQHFARSGFVCTKNYKLAAGTLPADRCPHPMEPMLRRLGLPTKLDQGKVELQNDVNVCAKGDVLTPEQCKILQIFGVQMAEFKIQVVYMWHKGIVKELEVAEAEEAEAEEAEDEQEEDAEFEELRTAGGDFVGLDADIDGDIEFGKGEDEDDDME